MTHPLNHFGRIDIYLFDQLLKGRFQECRRVLDAGCGGGRNLVYFLKNGHEVYAVDQNPDAVRSARSMAEKLAPGIPSENFLLGPIEELPYESATFDLVICNAVLHFARDEAHFDAMVRSMWRVLKPDGYFFARLASTIGTETLVKPLGNRRFILPDGSERFLVDESMLLEYTAELGGELFEYLKTTNVQNLRSMTTWCLHKTK